MEMTNELAAEILTAAVNSIKDKNKNWRDVAAVEALQQAVDALEAQNERRMVVFRDGDRLLHIDQDAIVELYRMKQRGELIEAGAAEWLFDGYYISTASGIIRVKCSRCGFRTLANGLDDYKYCPQCGKRMNTKHADT